MKTALNMFKDTESERKRCEFPLIATHHEDVN